jgi:hypothetical protein
MDKLSLNGKSLYAARIRRAESRIVLFFFTGKQVIFPNESGYFT